MQVKAKIVDENNEPLAGANVVVLNSVGQPATNGGFIVGDDSDFDGNFVINNTAISSVATLLRISYIGYNTIVIPVASIVATSGIIKMSPDTTVLDETVVYGQKKSGFNWWWLLLLPLGYGIHKATESKPKKVTM